MSNYGVFVRLTLVKRLFIWLTIIAFSVGTWAQAYAQNPMTGCAGSMAIASGDMVMHEAAFEVTAPHKADSHDPASYTADSGNFDSHKANHAKDASADCVKMKNCVALPVLMMPTDGSLHFKDWKQAVQLTRPVTMHGRSLEPELSPPIARV